MEIPYPYSVPTASLRKEKEMRHAIRVKRMKTSYTDKCIKKILQTRKKLCTQSLHKPKLLRSMTFKCIFQDQILLYYDKHFICLIKRAASEIIRCV